LTEALATPGNTVNIDAQLQEYNPQQMTTNLANLYGAGAYILLIKGDRITVIAKDLIMDYAQSTHDLIEDRYFRRKLPFFAAQGNQLYFMPRKKSFWTRGKIAAAAIGAMGASVFAFLKLRTPNATDLVPAIMDHDDAMALAYDPPPAGPDATDLDMYNPPNPNAMALGTGHDAIDVIAIDGGPDAVAPYISPTRTPAAIAAATAVAKPIAEPTTVETTISPVALQRLTETAAPTPEPTAMPTPEPTVPAAALWHQALNGSPIITCAMISDKYKETYPDAGYFAIRSKVADVLRDAGTLFPGYTKASKFQRIMVEREEYQVKVGELIRNDILQLATKGK
jgi:hypothetical protein